MIEQKKPVNPVDSMDFEDHLDRYLNPDDYDDDFCPLGADIFRETLGISIAEIMDEDESVDDMWDTKATGSDNND